MLRLLYCTMIYWSFISSKLCFRFVHPCSQKHYEKSQKVEATEMSFNRWMNNQMWCVCIYIYTHTLYYSALKGYKMIHPPIITWMKFEDIMLSEIKQSQTTNTVWSHLYEPSTTVKLIETKPRLIIARDWGQGKCRVV